MSLWEKMKVRTRRSRYALGLSGENLKSAWWAGRDAAKESIGLKFFGTDKGEALTLNAIKAQIANNPLIFGGITILLLWLIFRRK